VSDFVDKVREIN